MMADLPRAIVTELEALAARYGPPLQRDAVIDDTFDDPIRKPDRYGEVCMVIRRPSGRILLAIKTFYPRGAYRLPTGGIHHGEGVLDSLLRETHEETGLETEVRRFLARVSYRGRSAPRAEPLFHTFAFLLDETGGTLASLDPSEEIEDWLEIEPAGLVSVAKTLDGLTSPGTRSVGGDWPAWGRFRAVVHHAVAEALAVG